MGAFDSADRYLKMAENKRKKNPSNSNDMRVIVPMIKLKEEQSKQELRNLTFDEKRAKTEKVYRIFINKMEHSRHDLSTIVASSDLDSRGLDHLCSNPPFECIKTVIKSNLLKFSL